jgi:cobalt-zinc-cadmium efflux system outer membrane protein
MSFVTTPFLPPPDRPRPTLRRRAALPTALTASLALIAGCVSAGRDERAARDRLGQVGSQLASTQRLPSGQAPAAILPELRSNSSPAEFIRFAVLNHPAVAAAYYDWRASVEAIAPARALPDPRFTFEADIADTLMTFMPGLMFDFMSAGKRSAMSREATGVAEVAYRSYVAAVLRTAAEARKAWIELAYANETHELYAITIATADQAVALANIDYTTGRGGMGSFEKQLRLQNLSAQHHAHHASVVEQIVTARARFKAALGLSPDDPDPAWPDARLTPTALPPAEELWQRASTQNPELARMRAMVDMTVAGVDVARKANTPDFSVGAMVDTKADPLMVRPTASLSLPVWREKVAALVAGAQARHDAAAARVSAEKINLAAELARMLYMVRDSDRMVAYIDETALPNLERAISTLEAGVQSGMSTPGMISETRLMQVDLRHERLDALKERENAATDVLLMIADVAPINSPLLVGGAPPPR